MLQLKKTGMKCLKLVHLATACCWLGGATSMIIMNLNNDAAVSDGMLYGINTASHMVDIWVVVRFGALGCLFTGLVYGLFTPWKFFKHTWVTWKWIVTIAAILSGTFFLGVWEQTMLELSASLDRAVLRDASYIAIKTKHLSLSVVQIGALLFMIGISVFKPWSKKTGTKHTT